ncbi:hypothetical protein [Clostridium sp. JS66]|uniref:hypothetical protein n=1 Tax=Clostridium sp. JS66 TaxID=3064705 RepID=UPI00298EA3A6|nr:hypothetical protein [Clostridium sp. JS66]WPC39763.1 hypothetical protein Q6H37_17805 [Clostridium sp. JS66]
MIIILIFIFILILGVVFPVIGRIFLVLMMLFDESCIVSPEEFSDKKIRQVCLFLTLVFVIMLIFLVIHG